MHETGLIGDENGHYEGYVCGCENEGTPSYEAHKDADKNGFCDRCEYVTCAHNYASTYTTNKTQHWHAATCGCWVASEKEAHEDEDSNGKCDVCEYVLCAHTYETTYKYDEEYHWYENTCACDIPLDRKVHGDKDHNGKCDDCDYVICTHTQDERTYGGNGKYHWHALTCGCDILPADKELHTDMDKNDVCDTCEKSLKQEIVSLDGKKIIFIGDSFIYYGTTVLERSQTTYNRNHKDTGLFYQLCKANGENVHVTNFTFGGHGPSNIISESCTTSYGCAGKNHMSYLTDRYYDYVVISGGRNASNTAAGMMRTLQKFVDIFKEANPNVKFVYLVSSGAHNVTVPSAPTLPHDLLNGLGDIEDMGFTIVDWGAIVADILSGETTVPGGSITYNKNSFTVNRTAADGYHPNQLAGYITTLMTYAAITGRSAVGQPYDFVGDSSLSSDSNYRSFDAYIAKYYREGQTTNYKEVFASESEMRGIQMLIDRYLAEKSFRNYNFAPLAKASTASVKADTPFAILPSENGERQERL